MVYKRPSKTSQLKLHKFLKSRQDSRTLQLKKQLCESKASLIMLRQEVTNLTLEMEEKEEKLEKLEKEDNDNLKWAFEEISFHRDWRFELSEKYDKLFDSHAETRAKLIEIKESFKIINKKYADLLKCYFEDDF